MTAAAWLTRRQLRGRWTGLLPIALITALGGAGALVALEAAQRTSTAYPRYLARAGVGDFVINPSLATTEIDETIRGLPGLRRVTSDYLFFAAIDDEGTPIRYSDIPPDDPDNYTGVVGSLDGRYADMDRLAYRSGRPPTGPAEAVVSVDLAAARGFEVGDVVPVSFWNVSDDLRALYFGEDPLMTPVGVERLTIVGVATFPGEVLPDGLYPRGRMVVSPDVAARYDCLVPEPPSDATFEEALVLLSPEDCSVSYRYWSMAVDGGERGVEAAQEAFIRASVERNAALPAGFAEADVGYILITTTTATEQQRVQRSLQPTVAALAALGLAAGAITVVVTALGVTRVLRGSQAEQVQWWQLGLRVGERTRIVVVPILVALALGIVGALAVAWWWSPVGPVGSVRAVEPSPARGLGRSALLGGLALTLVLLCVVVVLGWRSARASGRTDARHRGPASARRLVRGTGPPEVAEGLRAVWGAGRGAGLAIASGGIASAAIVAALIFGTSLSTLLGTPAWYGWPWDVANLGGAGYGGIDFDEAATTLEQREDVTHWAGLGFWQSLTVDGVAVPSLVAYDGPSDVDLAMIDGRLPVAEDEVALGSRFAAERGLGVGDEVTLEGDGIVVERAEVTGLVVLPTVGPLQSDRATPGYGMLLPASALRPDLAAGLFTFVGLEIGPDADPDTVLEELRDDFRAWDRFGSPLSYTEPVVPAEIINARSMRIAPLLVASLVAAAAVVGLGAAMVASVGSRRRELGILRSLGFTGRQVRRSVRVQSMATVLAALVIGLPLGVIGGRYAWRTFADRLGVVTTPTFPPAALVITLVGALVLALLAAVIPARTAGRGILTDVLRGE